MILTVSLLSGKYESAVDILLSSKDPTRVLAAAQVLLTAGEVKFLLLVLRSEGVSSTYILYLPVPCEWLFFTVRTFPIS